MVPAGGRAHYLRYGLVPPPAPAGFRASDGHGCRGSGHAPRMAASSFSSHSLCAAMIRPSLNRAQLG